MKPFVLSFLVLGLLICVAQGAAPSENPGSSEDEVPTLFETEPGPPPAKQLERPVKDLDRKLEKSVLDLLKKHAGETKQENPLLRVGRRMRDAQERISKTKVGEETQTLQRQILEDLDALIEQARKQQQQGCPKCNDDSCADCQKAAQQAAQRQQAKPSNSGKGQRRNPGPSREAARSASKGRPIRAKLGPREAISKMTWGHLPPALQQLMTQISGEEFLPKYEPLIEQYYKTLAEQDPQRR